MATVTPQHRSKRSLSSCLKQLLPFVSLFLLSNVVEIQYYNAWKSTNQNIVVQLDDLARKPSNDVTVHQKQQEERNHHDGEDDGEEDDDGEDHDDERLLPNTKHIGAFQTIDRIYYINVDKRKDKRDFMESWLEPFSEKYSIPYQRISAKTWDDSCNNILGGEGAMLRCRGVKGLRNSNLHIMDTYNTTGYTLVLEDDFKILNYTRLLDGVKKAPDDWDVIRFDCTNQKKAYSPRMGFPQFEFGFRTVTPKEEFYCGGTHATLWRSDRLHTLRKLWEHPEKLYSGIDCLLSNDNIKSYCVQVAIGRLFIRELSSDIPKTEIVVAKDTH